MENISFKLTDNEEGAEIKFDDNTAELIKSVFNYNNVDAIDTRSNSSYYVATDMAEGKEEVFDNPLFMPLVFEETPYDTMVNGQVKSQGSKTQKMVFPLVLIEAARSKVIEVTSIEGRNGAIKEFSNLGNYEISIKGILAGNNGDYPKEQVKKLARLDNTPVAIKVANDFLQYIGVNKLIIRKINWRNMQGYENLQAFELDCISDEDIELVIEKGT